MWYRIRTFMVLGCLLMLIMAGSIHAPDRAVAAAAPLVFFDLTVSLEWQPGTDDNLAKDLEWQGCSNTALRSAYLDDLRAGLEATAGYIYSYTGGQMALRNIDIYTNGEHWDKADIRILVDNSFRPTAFVGGIVATPTLFTSPKTGASRVFYPGGILLGRQWDGAGARCGSWAAAEGWRTIGHEWGHYALYLWDGYINQSTHQAQYCTSSSLSPTLIEPASNPLVQTTDSLMAYHYRADQLWRSSKLLPEACKGTPQTEFYDLAEWETLQMFYPVTIPDRDAAPVDPRGAAAFLSISDHSRGGPGHSAARTVIKPTAPAAIGQAYLIFPDSAGRPQRILGQGLMLAGERELILGANPARNGRAAVLMENWTTGQRLYYPKNAASAAVLDPASINKLDPTPSRWKPGVRIVPLVMPSGPYSFVRGFQIEFCDCDGHTKRVEVVYCPAGGQCHAAVPATVTGKSALINIWLGPQEEAADHGYFYLRNRDTNEETVTWYQLAGGVGPATAEIHAPLLDSEISTAVADESYPLDSDTNVLYAPADLCSTSLGTAPELPLLGTPMRVEPVVAGPDGGTPWSRKESPLVVRLSYSQDLLDRLGVDEHDLIVLFFDRQLQKWTPVQASGQSLELDWIAAAPQNFDSAGGIYALAYKP
ncbi:MAG: hypothetical protein H0T53_01945 [Herpetosiphonaceae bacterium]|nr:hypothetical protein [Herpetosiphonaceae bacterium]